jgi:Sec-independent protein translocase protein TatA
MFTILVFALLVVACGCDSLTEIHRDLGKYYDALRPPLQEFQRSANRVINQNAYHSKRCALVEVGSAVRAFKSNTYDTKGQV